MKIFAASVLMIMVTAAIHAAADDGAAITAQVTALQQAIDLDGARTPPDPGAAKAGGYMRLLNDNIARGNFSNAVTMADNVATTDPTPAVQKLVDALTPLLKKAQADQVSGLSGQTKTALDDATNAVKTKSDPKDFDVLLVEIQTALDQARTNPTADRELSFNQLQAASRFVREWQSYLVDKSAGNTQGVTNDLRQLTEGFGNDSFMPIARSDLLQLALKEAGQAPGALAARIDLHSLDDIPAALSQLEMVQRSGNSTQEIGNMLNSLQNLQGAYANYQSGNYTAALQQLANSPFGFIGGGMITLRTSAAPPGLPDSLAKDIAGLKSSLMLKIVQALLAMPDAPAPQADERASDYLQRLAADRSKAADWPGLQQVLQVYQQTNMFNPPSWLLEDLTGLRAYLIGEKLEQAGQDLDAIRSYRQSLATIGKYFPAAPAAAKLDALKKAHPDLYQEALQQPIVPATMAR